jgi:hypothetical protein
MRPVVWLSAALFSPATAHAKDTEPVKLPPPQMTGGKPAHAGVARAALGFKPHQQIILAQTVGYPQ